MLSQCSIGARCLQTTLGVVQRLARTRPEISWWREQPKDSGALARGRAPGPLEVAFHNETGRWGPSDRRCPARPPAEEEQVVGDPFGHGDAGLTGPKLF